MRKLPNRSVNIESETRKLRKACGLTVSELAERTGMSERGLYKIDRGEVQPRIATAVLLAAALGCRPTDLIAGADG